jgi:hypothetical protein
VSTIDEEVRVALENHYPPAETGTVAIDVWERLAAGDTGTPGRRGDGPGGGLLSWLPWIAGALVVGGLALLLGTTGIFGRPTHAVSVTPTIGVTRTVDATDCPGGIPVLSLAAGSRVLALQVTADGGWVAVRDPRDAGRLGWVPAGVLTPDAGTLTELPVGGCAFAEVTPPTPTLEPTDDPEPLPTGQPDPGPAPEPEPAPDGTAPKLSGGSVSYTPAVGYTCSEQSGSSATVSVTAKDAVGVTSVTATLSGADSGSRAFSAAGGSTWSTLYQPSGLSVTGPVTFTVTARDAAGNTSSPIQVVVQRDQCPG